MDYPTIAKRFVGVLSQIETMDGLVDSIAIVWRELSAQNPYRLRTALGNLAQKVPHIDFTGVLEH